VRYLSRAFAIGALQRGRQVEQFLGSIDAPAGIQVVRWSVVRRSRRGYEAWSYDVEDLDDDQFLDLMEFPPWGSDSDDEPGAVFLGCADDPQQALRLAEEGVGASPTRWVNEGVAGDDYADLVRARRNGEAWPAIRLTEVRSV
jgi:hypothetical protein